MAFNEASAKVQAFESSRKKFPEIKEMQERYEEENQRGRFLEQQYMENMRDQYERELVKSQIEKRMQHQYHLEQVQTYQGIVERPATTTHIEENDAACATATAVEPSYHHAPQLSSESDRARSARWNAYRRGKSNVVENEARDNMQSSNQTNFGGIKIVFM